MKTILVTGRNGFVARALVERLKDKYRVISLVRKLKDNIDYSNEEVVVIDNRMVQDTDVKKYNIELIIHLAASIRGRRKELLENNIQASKAIFKIAESLNIPVIYLSSTNVLFSDCLGAYAFSKKECEKLLVESKLNYLILRAPLIIGKDSPSIKTVRGFYQKFMFFPLFGAGGGKVQPIHISSIIDKILDKVGEGINSRQVLNLVGNHIYSYRDIITHLLGQNKKTHFIKIPFLLSKFVIGIFEKANIPFFVSSEELKSINMDKIVKNDIPDNNIEYVNNDNQIFIA